MNFGNNENTMTMKFINIITIVIFASTLFFTGCEKVDVISLTTSKKGDSLTVLLIQPPNLQKIILNIIFKN